MFWRSRSPDPSRVRLRDVPDLVRIHRAADERRKLMAEPDLTYLFWEATLRCNLRCAHCGSGCEATSPLAELETTQILRIVDTIAEDFDARRIFASITGGEPLLRKDLVEVVAHMQAAGMRTSIVTNGTLLSEERAAALVEAGMRTVSISVDGLRAEHEALRGPGTFAQVIRAVRHARAAGFDDVEAITCVRPSTVATLPQIEAEVRAAGANLWRLITIDTMGRQAGAPDETIWLGPADARAALDFIAQRRRQISERCEDFDVQFSCGGFLGPARELAVRHRYGQCYAGLCVGSILCDGSVSACPSLPRSWAQGSALEDRFSTIWRTRFAKHRDTSWRHTGPCTDCDWFAQCLGGGLHEREAQPDHFCWLQRQSGG
ncbi:MAG: radical SAM protein [Deltaproteobacteria bacterium]|jgi:radical SAM protein with 4Fe4S-binding SPASM domain|nr:radical SAM protein [Deltaproteobacteria bacterium]MBW2533114.1 radical SAM protein [Deltaproteobacteria bacterium]